MIDHAYKVELYHVTGESINPPHEPEVIYDSITGLGAAFESAESERGAGECPSIDFESLVTADTEAFLKPITDPRNVHVIVTEYDNFKPTTTVARFAGKLVDLPRRSKDADNDVYIFHAVGFLGTYNEVELTDPASLGGPFRDEYFVDLVENVLTAAGHGRGLSIQPKALTSATEFTSRLFYPGRHRFGGGYNTTDRITALTSDGTYLYLGVGRWLCRYDPATRERVKLAQLQYTGTRFNLLPEQFRIESIEYDAGTIYGWAESKYPSLFEDVAHAKFRFTWAAGPTIQLTDANQIYNYGRGYFIKSTAREAKNYGGPATPPTEFAEWFYHDIGEAQPVSDKNLGIPLPVNRGESVLSNIALPGIRILQVTPVGRRFYLGDRVYLKCGTHRQDMGVVKRIIQKPGDRWKIEVEKQTRYLYTVAPVTNVYWYTKAQLKSRDNIVMPGLRDVKIHYDQANAEGSATPVSVRVEKRRNDKGKDCFYWPETLGTVSEDTTVAAFTPYLALGECNTAQQYETAPNNYRSEAVPAFNLHIEDVARFANLPVAGYWVENGKRESTQDQIGPNRLMFGGNAVFITNETGDLETYGNIFLAQEGNNTYCAFNRWKQGKYEKFYQTVWGELDGAEFTKIGTDRQGYNYRERPPRELTGFAHYDNRYWFGVKRIEPRWINTAIQFIWAAPPQNEDKPADYDGGLVVVCMVTFDKTEYLKPGTLFRVGTFGNPGDKEYIIAEAVAVPPKEIVNTNHSYDIYDWEARTYITAFELETYSHPVTYSERAKTEMIGSINGGFLTVSNGWIKRGEICYAQANELKDAHTATAPFRDNFEGDSYDYREAEWHGEDVQPEMYSRMAEADLQNENVVDPVLMPIVVTLKDGKEKLKVVDKTDLVRGEMRIPPLGEVYLDRSGTYDAGEATLYFNPAYAGMLFDVEYHYYPERFYIEPFIHNGSLHFNEVAEAELTWRLDPLRMAETATAAIYRYDAPAGDWERVTAWPSPVGTVVAHGDDVYALAYTRGALMRYGKESPGYITVDVGGPENTVDAFNVLTEISKTVDMFLGEESGVIKLRHRGAGDSVGFQLDCEDFIAAELTETPKYQAVLITYADGKAYYGPADVADELILKKSMKYVTDYGLALLLAKRYFDYYHSGAMVYALTVTRDRLALPILGEVAEVGDVTGRVLSYQALGPTLSLRLEKAGERLNIGAPAWG